ncbi:hypothetical protein NDU88_000548 [Pleurodeles waltl]|uniref:Uncharacterized protein n=1 Tax=Pleurodeles waltl TaxID=8319 RepID=A0AAV7WJB2_PLEWA|nr:hypothetical protein NDU88_000548 [Pleurodeles waltl]
MEPEQAVVRHQAEATVLEILKSENYLGAGTVLPGHFLAVIPVTEKSYRRAVLPPFLDGLNSLKSVAETLQTSNDILQDIQHVDQLIKASVKSLTEAENASNVQVRALSSNLEERFGMIKSLDDEMKSLEAQEQGLKEHLSGLQVQESLARQQLQEAQQAVNNANDALHRAMAAKQAAEEEQKLGIGLIFIPIVGPIMGGITISKANEAIDNAEKMEFEAILDFNHHSRSVSRYEDERQSYSNEIHSTKQKIWAKTREIQNIQQNLNREGSLQQKLTNFIIPLRKCTTLLSTLAGKTIVGNMLMELSGTLVQLLPIMNEIVETVRPLVENSTDYQLLISARLTNIIHKLKEANRRVKEAVACKQ